MNSLVKSITESKIFKNIVLILIVAYAILLGIELYIKDNYALKIIEWGIIGFFMIEIALRISATKPRHKFFFDSWNIFDFLTVYSALIPAAQHSLAIFRILRILRTLRTLRIVSFSKDLRLVIDTLFQSFKSLMYISLLILLLFYVYGVVGTVLFADISPSQFGSLHITFLTLFKAMTLNWVSILEGVGPENLYAQFYLISFIIFGTYLMLNVFMALVVSQVQAMKEKKQGEK